MSGRFDTVIVIGVPGGPLEGDIVTCGLGSVERSVVAETESYNGMMNNTVNTKKIRLFNLTKFQIITNKI